MAAKLDEKALQSALLSLPGWQASSASTAISKSFRFKDFNQAFAAMTRIALMAEKMDHHPDWSNVYNRLEITLSTHDQGGVTQKDLKLAAFIDQCCAQ